jgi:hypothetical protein
MPVVSGGQHESGLDRALDTAFNRSLDTILESGQMPADKAASVVAPRPVSQETPTGRGWQVPLTSEERPSLKPRTSLWQDVRAGLRRRPAPESATDAKPTAEQPPAGTPPPVIATESAGPDDTEKTKPSSPESTQPDDAFHFIDERVGIVVVHGIGPQLAGQTLLDWTRPIIELLSDWREVHKADLVDQPKGRFLADPVFKASIDFSGETFPTVQIVVPGIRSDDPDDPRSKQRRWVFTETWWAQEVRPPTLATMIGWLGEQGGVGRIVSGIVENTFGGGKVAQLAEVSLRAFMSVIVSFVLLVFLVLLGLSKLIPFGPLRDAVVLGLASSFITDWFGGARTLLRDPAQSANVRGRLVTTIKAVRAYGCREVIVIAHSGGTMVSWMTLTDPAWPDLRIQKLITHGEALNLAWRLQAVNPDDPKHPELPDGDRMTGNLAERQPDLLWRDFWATNDPAPSGRPILPKDVADGGGRFTEEKVWNRMSLGEDHGTYWDDDEHFLLPLVRELDVPSGDRGGSRFYDDHVEATLRNRRKQRVSLLALWRRVAFALPVMAVLTAATMTFPGAVPEAGDTVMGAVRSVPGHEIFDTAGQALSGLGNGQIVFGITWTNVYGWGRIVFQAIFLVLILVSLAPVRAGPQWEGHWKARLTFTVIDVGVGLGLLGLLIVVWLLTFLTGVTDNTRVGNAVNDVLLRSGVLWTALLVIGVFALGSRGPAVRKEIRRLQGKTSAGDRAKRIFLVSASAVVLAGLLVGVVVAAFGMALVLAGNSAIDDSNATRRFALGVVLVLVAFNFMARLGTWRWDVWDRRERRQARRRPLVEPNRAWAFLQALLLLIPLVLGAFVVSLGTSTWQVVGLDRGGVLTVIGVVLVLIGMISVARDVVESDTEGQVRDGEAAPVMPSQTPPAAGQPG